MAWIGPEKSRAEIIAYWQGVLARADVAPIAHGLAKEALRELEGPNHSRDTDDGQPVTKRDQAPG